MSFSIEAGTNIGVLAISSLILSHLSEFFPDYRHRGSPRAITYDLTWVKNVGQITVPKLRSLRRDPMCPATEEVVDNLEGKTELYVLLRRTELLDTDTLRRGAFRLHNIQTRDRIAASVSPWESWPQRDAAVTAAMVIVRELEVIVAVSVNTPT
jgi:hypothetical protein